MSMFCDQTEDIRIAKKIMNYWKLAHPELWEEQESSQHTDIVTVSPQQEKLRS